MTEAKTIKLLLSNGSLTGLLVAELLKWDGILFASPRASYQLLSSEIESKFWGVYLLVSENRVYIGQANDLLRRIAEHDKSKDWWNKVVLLTTKDNSLNRSDIDFLENKLIEIAKDVGTLEIGNIQSGNSPKVSRYRETELLDYLDGGLLLLELIGIRVFVRNHLPNKFKPNTTDTTKSIANSQILYETLQKKDAIQLVKQSGYSLENTFVTFASLQRQKSVYWANPSIEFSKGRWCFLLNDQESRILTILLIDPENPKITKNIGSHLHIRKDKPYYFDLNIDKNTIIDVNSKFDFSEYIVSRIKY